MSTSWALHLHSRNRLGLRPAQAWAGLRRKAYDGGQSSATSVIYSLHWHVLLHFQQDPEMHLIPSSSGEVAGKSSWVEDRAEHVVELVCPLCPQCSLLTPTERSLHPSHILRMLLGRETAGRKCKEAIGRKWLGYRQSSAGKSLCTQAPSLLHPCSISHCKTSSQKTEESSRERKWGRTEKGRQSSKAILNR